MKKELLRHIEILKTVPEIKESIEELKLGCIIETKYGIEKVISSKNGNIYTCFMDKYGILNQRVVDTEYITKIIGQIHEGHLRMFLDKRSATFYFFSPDGRFRDLYPLGGKLINTDIQLDNTKPYMEQSEEFFKKLNDWIILKFNSKLGK